LLNSSKFLYILILYSSLRYYLFPYTTLFRSCQLHVTQSLRTFQAQQSTADHRATLGAAAAFLHRLQIIDGAIDETVLAVAAGYRSEEHTSELQSRENLVCRLLLAKKKLREYL